MNNMYFWFIQFVGIAAWFMLVISYYRKNTNKILVFQITGTLLYVLHYFMLNAYSGLLICAFEVLRDFSYYKTDKDNYIFVGSIPIYIIFAIFSYNTFMDLLPIFSSLIDGFSLTKHKKIVVFGAVVSYTLWVIYDIVYKSYSGAVTDGIIALSNLSILLFNKDLLKRNIKTKGIKV